MTLQSIFREAWPQQGTGTAPWCYFFKLKGEDFMRLIHAAAFALCLLTVAPVGSFAGDPKSDVSAA